MNEFVKVQLTVKAVVETKYLNNFSGFVDDFRDCHFSCDVKGNNLLNQRVIFLKSKKGFGIGTANKWE